MARPGRLGLNAAMAAAFVCLSLPVLLFILIYNYRQSVAATVAALDRAVEVALESAVERTQEFIRPVGATLEMLSAMAGSHPAFFRTEASADLLFRCLLSADQIDAIYTSFEDGYHRVVTRIDDDRRRSDRSIPANAQWHSSWIDDFSVGAARSRHRTFFEAWGERVGGYSAPTEMDVRRLNGYPQAKARLALVITEPDINPDTGYPVLFLRYPILRDGVFIGASTANITMDVLSRFLATHRVSAGSRSVVADPRTGMVIAASERERSVQLANGRIRVATLETIDDADIREAARLRQETGRDKLVFTSPVNGEEISAAFAPVPGIAGGEWQIGIFTPTNDFVGALKASNRHMMLVIAGLTALELLLIIYLAARLSRPIESISEELRAVETLSFAAPAASRPSPKIREIAHLQSTAALLRNSLQSFASFVPMDIVRELIRTGRPLTLGVEPRELTLFFSDIENFSTHAEQLDPAALMEQMSAYFELVSAAIHDEHGTVDKFIGDGVMAFWGAPASLEDHAFHACTGALRALRRLERENAAWQAEGRPAFGMRIGLHTGEALVGNVGSAGRLSYTAMGDAVNVAARLEGVNKIFGTAICVSESVVAACGERLVLRPLRTVEVKGRVHPVMTYELLGIAGSGDSELRAGPHREIETPSHSR